MNLGGDVERPIVSLGRGQVVQRTGSLAEERVGQMGVQACGLDRLVSQQRPDHFDVPT